MNRAGFSVPMRRNRHFSNNHIVPLNFFSFIVHYSDLHKRFVTESAFYQICLRIRFQRMAEKRIIPPFLRPSVRFTPIFHGSPVSNSHHFIVIHSIKRSGQFRRSCFTLVHNKVRSVLQVLLICIVLIIKTRHFRHKRKFWGCHVIVEPSVLPFQRICTGRKHRNGGFAGIVVSFYKHIEYFVSRDSPVVRWKSGQIIAHLKLISQAPQNHRRVISVAFNPFGNVTVPNLRKRLASRPIIFFAPFVIKFIYDKNTVFVSQF